MKKVLLTFIIAFTAFSCSDAEPEVYKASDGSLAYFTSGTSGSFFIQEVPNPEFLIEVGITTASSSDRSFSISIDPEETTATVSQYTIEQSSLFIPANSNVGYIKVIGNYENALTSGSKLVINLESVENGLLANFDTTYTLNIYQFCPFQVSDFLGSWNADEVGYAVYNSNFTAGANADLNEIVMSNIWDVNPASQTKVYFNDSNPSNFKLDFPVYTDNPLYVDSTYGQAWIDRGTGNFSSCAETVYMRFQVRVNAGFFAATEIYFSRP